MFDATKLSWRSRLSLLACAGSISVAIGACFSGADSWGLPCENDAQCGVGHACVDGFCGGEYACQSGATIPPEFACDGMSDCANGDDESLELCGEDSAFVCGDGELVPGAFACDGYPDCLDESDEGSVCAGIGVNECPGPSADIFYAPAASSAGVGNPLAVEAFDIMGSPGVDALIAADDGTEVIVAFDLETTSPKRHSLNMEMPPFGGRLVKAVEVGDVNGDNRDDIIIAAASTEAGGALYVYQNNTDMAPTLFGSVIDITELTMIEPEVRGVSLGRLNNDSSTDIAAVLDVGPANGVIVSAFGDSNAAASGGQYFTPEALMGQLINYDAFIDSVLADIDGDNIDELLVVGIDGSMPTLWTVDRSSIDGLAWDMPVAKAIMFPGPIALGRFGMAQEVGAPLGPRPDVAIMDLLNGRILTLRNMGGVLQNAGIIELMGSEFSDLVLGDINCDGMDDFIYNVGDPARVEILLGNGEGGVQSSDPLLAVAAGVPRGPLALAEFDTVDETPDIFMMADAGNGLSEPQLQVLVSGLE